MILIDAIACAVIVLGGMEAARRMDSHRRHHLDRLTVLLVSAGALGMLLQILAEAFHPSPFGTLMRVGLAIHFGRVFAGRLPAEHAS